MKKKFEKNFFISGIIASHLVSLGYLSLAANILENSPTIWHINKRYFFQLHSLEVIIKYDKGAAVQISIVFVPIYRVACLWVL